MFGRIVWRAIRGGIAMLLFGCIDPPVGVRFETLAMGERVDMSYETEGCFEHMTAKLVFTRLPDGLAIESRTPELRIEVKKHLDLRAMRRLDASLHAIRFHGSGYCTKVERIRIRWPNGVGHYGESLVNSNCATYDQPEFLSVASLLHVTPDTLP